MGSKDANILEAATRCFVRYGFSKTTMNDIAREAGVARQTLYNAYPGKNDVLRAAMRNNVDAIFEQVENGWAEMDSFEDKLDLFYQLGPLAWWDMVQTAPDTAELIDGLHSVGAEVLNEANARWAKRFEALISEHFPETTDIPSMADFLFSSAANAKVGASDRAMIERRLLTLRRAVVALLAV